MARARNPENAGKTGRIRELGLNVHLTLHSGTANCAVDWDDGTRDGVTRFIKSDGRRVRRWSHTDQLEPILDNHQPCDTEFKRDLDRMLESALTGETQ